MGIETKFVHVQPYRARARICLKSFSSNVDLLYQRANKRPLIPMLKANAYGHGALELARHLEGNEKVIALGVATLAEGVTLRSQGISAPRILVFSDSAAWSEERAKKFQAYRLEPVVNSDQTLKAMVEHAQWRVPFHLEMNSGMNRLGVTFDAIRGLLPKIKSPILSFLSHFAESDCPDSKLTQSQMKRFWQGAEFIRTLFPETKLHFANSGGIANFKKLKLDRTDYVRPGLSLYGIHPSPDCKISGLKPVMTLEAPILSTFQIQKGDRIGYSGTYQARSPQWVSTVGAGYADGVHRSLSNLGIAQIGKQKCRILGRISMDVITVSASRNALVGSWVEFWGKNVDAWKQAQLGKTIPYELFTSVSDRVFRVYE